MDALKVLLERRSIRKYRAVNVSDEVLQEIVEAFGAEFAALVFCGGAHAGENDSGAGCHVGRGTAV